MLVHRRVTPSIKFAGTHLYTWVERGTVRVKCLAQEHNAMTLARARTRAARPGDERTNHEATTAPTFVRINQLGFFQNEPTNRTVRSSLQVSLAFFHSSIFSWCAHLTERLTEATDNKELSTMFRVSNIL